MLWLSGRSLTRNNFSIVRGLVWMDSSGIPPWFTASKPLQRGQKLEILVFGHMGTHDARKTYRSLEWYIMDPPSKEVAITIFTALGDETGQQSCYQLWEDFDWSKVPHPQGVWADAWRKKKAQRKEEISVSSNKVEVNTDDLYTDRAGVVRREEVERKG